MASFKIFIVLIIALYSPMNECKSTNHWSSEEFLTREFKNNLGSLCKLVAEDGKITGQYFTKPSRGQLIQPGFPIHGVYTPVKDGALLSIVTFKMEGGKPDGLEKYSQVTSNGKVYVSKRDFNMNLLLISNESEDDECSAFLIQMKKRKLLKGLKQKEKQQLKVI